MSRAPDAIDIVAAEAAAAFGAGDSVRGLMWIKMLAQFAHQWQQASEATLASLERATR